MVQPNYDRQIASMTPEELAQMKDRAREGYAHIRYLSEMSDKGTPVDQEKGYRFVYDDKVVEVYPHGWLKYSFDPNNPEELKHILASPLRFGNSKPVKIPSPAARRKQMEKEFEEYLKAGVY